MTFFLLFYPEECLKSARFGLNLWFSVVLPSLFPFMTASFILLETGIVKLISHVFAPVTRFLFSAPGESAYVFFASAFSGYPVGARLAGELYEKKQISAADAQSIIRFTSVSGPIFIMGAIAAGMLGAPETAAYLAASHYLSAVFTGIIFGIFGKRELALPMHITFKDAFYDFKKDLSFCKPFGELLSDSVEKALLTLVKIGGLIVFFSVIMEILNLCGVMDALAFIYSPFSGLTGLDLQSTKAVLIGGIEMTNGCSTAAAMSMPLIQKLPIISSIIAFGGMCIHMQTKSVCVKSGLVPKYFVLTKSIQAFIAYMICASLLFISPLNGAVADDIRKTAYFGFAFVLLLIISFIITNIIRSRWKRIAPEVKSTTRTRKSPGFLGTPYMPPKKL